MQADAAFRQECWATGWDPPPPPEARRDCISDEHYIPVLLVLLGLEQETLCYAGVTFTFWGEAAARRARMDARCCCSGRGRAGSGAVA